MTGEILQGSIPVLCLGHIQLAGDERSGSIRSFVGDGAMSVTLIIYSLPKAFWLTPRWKLWTKSVLNK